MGAKLLLILRATSFVKIIKNPFPSERV